jgi:hypothetical protein
MTGTLKITGKKTAGSTLTVAPGTLADSNGIYNLTYEWKSGNTVLSTNSSYILTAADLKTDISVTALYVHSDGTPTTSTTSHIFNHVHTGTVSINGATTVGNTLTAATSLKDADGLGTLSYKWTNSAGETLGDKMTYKVKPADYANSYNYINLTVSYTDKLGYAESETKSTGFITYSKQTSAANDILTSTMILDKLTGGLGSDTFVFANSITSTNTNATRDVITDFNHSQKDKIDLSGITTLLGFSSDNSPAAHKVWFDTDTSILYGSTTSNTVADFAIQLTGVAVLETTDVAFYVAP